MYHFCMHAQHKKVFVTLFLAGMALCEVAEEMSFKLGWNFTSTTLECRKNETGVLISTRHLKIRQWFPELDNDLFFLAG